MFQFAHTTLPRLKLLKVNYSADCKGMLIPSPITPHYLHHFTWGAAQKDAAVSVRVSSSFQFAFLDDGRRSAAY